ncbi:MAG: hypothetical protein IT350_19165 [Deltaproteobacteria bacterium]|nr:hypothetical protein [Deltaproteobacteria bacterium]
MKPAAIAASDVASVLSPFVRERPHYATDWHREWTREDHARLLENAMTHDAADGELMALKDGATVFGVATWKESAWDHAYFGLRHGRIGVLLADDIQTARNLATAVTESMAIARIEWGAAIVDARAKSAITALQESGWRVVWACAKMVCDTARVDASATGFRDGELEVLPTTPDHVPILVEAANRLHDTHWLQTLDELPLDRRRVYVGELTRNCCTTDFADVNLTLLRKGVPIGHNASKFFFAPEGVTALSYTFERNTFIDPALQSAGYGRFLERAVVKTLQSRVRLLTGRVRIEAPGMFRILERAGFESRGGELYFARRF